MICRRRIAPMRLNPSLLIAAFLGAVSLNLAAAAQEVVPTPPPAGVKPVPRKQPPAEPVPSAANQVPPAVEAQPAPQAQPEALPQIPENPIRLEDQRSLVPGVVQPAPVAPQPNLNGQVPLQPQMVPG